MAMAKIIITSYAESVEQLSDICRLSESLSTFGGEFQDTAVRAYVPDDVDIEDEFLHKKLESLNIELYRSHTPEDARWFYYAGKVYAAAQAESDSLNQDEVLAWLDYDTIFLSEPLHFDLPSAIDFAYKPVMHNRSGSLYDNPPDEFWGRIYDKFSLTDGILFHMVTPADKQKIRAYFQAGLLVVRPNRSILRQWPRDFELLYTDPTLAEMCRQDVNKRIFLHQTALVGSVLHSVGRESMLELSDQYNYPLFFESQYGATEAFDSIENVVTMRMVVSRKSVGDEWHRRIKGPAEKIAWLKENLFK